ncbi:hypothetical protein A8C75_18445 [Marinobacterium aestuarii]|uniref:Uncharacterized protein n=1 Tax=Marinobacterium aestuarii TaxID=1821621 RepID=A0A1A9F2P6_9GAMM|nr:hypothetical protein [Marinobacterium aestuarii]ANG64260.1 hypothetical protein A8C75_18445 [Marinobacterium aestuarii]
MYTDPIQSRIETYTCGLTPAVQAGNGAEFSLLLSLISVNQLQYPALPAQPLLEASVPARPGFPDPNDFYTAELTGQLNQAVSEHQTGEFAMLCSYLDTAARTPGQARQAQDQFEQVALMSSGRLMLDQIAGARVQLSA